MEANSSSQMGAFFLTDVCQLSSSKNIGSREHFLPRLRRMQKSKECKEHKKMLKKLKMQEGNK